MNRFHVKRMVVSTYQAASGAGAAAMRELELQTKEVLEGKPPTTKIFSRQYAFNLFSHNSAVLSNGYNEEEMKLVKETRKIWSDNDVKVTATCIRVPVMRAHTESINLQFENQLDEDTAREILKKSPGLEAEFAVMCPKRGTMGWISVSAVIKYARELHLMLFRLPRCRYS
ncbi:hypothetical protein EV1_011185 [Malus domestica]